MTEQNIMQKLNTSSKTERLNALKQVMQGYAFPLADPRYINNHIHTTYSFSPYSPTAAAFMARANGLCTAGIMDHDSMGGAEEFIEAGRVAGIPVTVGIEFRVSMAGTPLESRRTNNPDQIGVSYMTLHAVPHEKISDVQAYFAPMRELRNTRNIKMVEAINALVAHTGIRLDFESDVLPLSCYSDGGSVTERHLMFALAKQAVSRRGRGAGVVELLSQWGIALDKKQETMMLSADSPYYEYDLMGILKSAFVPKVFIPATAECPSLREAVSFGKSIGGIFCYAYLGDITSSVTGDKAAQKFEDDYLTELFETMKSNDVRAITYMPPRNTPAQLLRLRELCEKCGMFQISGEDINSPRQDFVCRAMEDPLFENLIDAAWALIDHENGKRKILI